MTPFPQVAILVIVTFCGIAPATASAQTITTLASGLDNPSALTLDSSGNIFFAQRKSANFDTEISELSATDRYSTVRQLGNGLGDLSAVVVDNQGNLFLADPDHAAVKVFKAADGYAASSTIGGPFMRPSGLAIDGAGNIFVADPPADAVIELLAAEGYTANHSLGTGFHLPTNVALDPSGNLFVSDTGHNVVKELVAAGGYATVKTLAHVFDLPGPIVVDTDDVVFVAQRDAIMRMSPADSYQSATIVGINFDITPAALAIDAAGNLFLSGPGVQEIPAAGGYKSLVPIPSLGLGATGLAVDASGNLYAAEGYGTVQKVSPSEGYATATTVILGITLPNAMAADGAGHLFVAAGGTLYVMPAAGGVAVPRQLAANVEGIGGIGVDGSGNVFVIDIVHNLVKELLASDGYASARTLGTGFKNPAGLAVDAQGNVFVADSGNGVIKEITAADGYTTVKIVSYRPDEVPEYLAVDPEDNLFVIYYPGFSSITELMASDGYLTRRPVGSGFVDPVGVAVDTSGNVFVPEGTLGAVKEIKATPPALVAAVLPGARSVRFDTPATVLATMINSGPNPLGNCQIGLSPDAVYTLSPGQALESLTLTFQATNPATNSLIGTPDTPVTLAPNGGSASFLLVIQGMTAETSSSTSTLQDMPIDFSCASATGNSIETAAVVPGIDTLDLFFSTDAVTDVIALAATTTNNGVVNLPKDGMAAFAVASINLGQANTLAVSVDTGNATLPLTATVCPTDTATGQCVAPAAASTNLNFSTNATPTFSVFLQATGSIPFAPDLSRVFVRFKDLGGVLHGSTSIAVSAD